MFPCFSSRTQNGCTPTTRFHGRSLLCILSSIGLLSACGSHSAVSNMQAANSALNISGSLPQGAVGASYKAALTVTGGTSPYTFSVASGQLPTGVQLAKSSGTFSGTPTASGNFSFAVSVSDSSGQSQQKSLQIAVSNDSSGSSSGPTSGSSGGNTGASNAPAETSFSNLQRSAGWSQFGQGSPTFVDCSPSPCDGISFSMTQGVSSPSLSGDASEFNVGGTTPYSDALFNNHLIGPSSSQGMPDSNGTVVPSLHDFTYDVYFYGDNLDLAQALEFDVNQFFGGMGFIWGNECRIASGNQWDVWDNQNARWTPTGIPCHPNSNSWNHVTIKVQRNADNTMQYNSITLNGETSTLNWAFGHGSAPNWYGVTINYQMDGNQNQDSYNIYLDNLTISYQ
jgi:Putative Ig domain